MPFWGINKDLTNEILIMEVVVYTCTTIVEIMYLRFCVAVKN